MVSGTRSPGSVFRATVSRVRARVARRARNRKAWDAAKAARARAGLARKRALVESSPEKPDNTGNE